MIRKSASVLGGSKESAYWVRVNVDEWRVLRAYKSVLFWCYPGTQKELDFYEVKSSMIKR